MLINLRQISIETLLVHTVQDWLSSTILHRFIIWLQLQDIKTSLIATKRNMRDLVEELVNLLIRERLNSTEQPSSKPRESLMRLRLDHQLLVLLLPYWPKIVLSWLMIFKRKVTQLRLLNLSKKLHKSSLISKNKMLLRLMLISKLQGWRKQRKTPKN